MMEGFGVEDYCWYDNILVWGDFWKDLLAKASSYYPPGVLRVAANKHIYKPLDYSSIGANGSRKILVPYEFLANTEKIGCYIRALLMKGYEIYFKTRPDEPIDAQLDCYLLTGEERNQIVIVEEITDELMKKIDIVAGTSTTLIYDLLPYRKQTWVFDTDFCLLDQLVIRGVSKLIHLETLEEDIRRPLPEISIDFVNYVFRQIQLPEALREVLIS